MVRNCVASAVSLRTTNCATKTATAATASALIASVALCGRHSGRRGAASVRVVTPCSSFPSPPDDAYR